MMKIKEIVLYPHEGKKRIVPLNEINTIIVGEPDTGKTALSEIVEYCLGKETCEIPDGKIRDCVSWYGLLLTLSSTNIFIARKNPEPKNFRSNQAYYEIGEELQSPEVIPNSHTTIDTVVESLTTLMGIAPNLRVSLSQTMRIPVTLNFKNSLYYCFQQQEDLITKHAIFHRQNTDPMFKQTIKVTLPYFLGAIPENLSTYEFELIKTRKELFRLEQELREYESIRSEGISKAQGLIALSRELGLIKKIEIDEKPETFQHILKQALLWKPTETSFPQDSELDKFQKETRIIMDEMDQLNQTINNIKSAEDELTNYTKELQFQNKRLDSIGLYDAVNHDSKTCPFCLNELKENQSHVTAIQNSIKNLRKSLELTTKEKPKVREQIEKLELKRNDLNSRLQQKLGIISQLVEQKAQYRNIQDLNFQRAHLQGQIQFWLDSVNLTNDSSPLRNTIEEKRNHVKELEDKLDEGKIEKRLDSTLKQISLQIGEWARELKLDNSDNIIHLDLTKPTLFFQSSVKTIDFAEIGGTLNGVAYHILLHLALHKHFIDNNRPVPSFLIINQPSQINTPKTESDNSDKLSAEDELNKLLKFYNLIFKITKNMSSLQLIITENTELPDDTFKSFILERWTPKNALVPDDWKPKLDL